MKPPAAAATDTACYFSRGFPSYTTKRLVCLRPPISGVTRVGDTRGRQLRVSPLYFLVASSAVSSLVFFFSLLLKTWRPFLCFAHCCHYHYRFLLLSLGCHPSRVSSHTFLPVRPRFSTILCKFVPNNFFRRVSPLGGCHPGRSAPLRPLVTPLAPILGNTLVIS